MGNSTPSTPSSTPSTSTPTGDPMPSTPSHAAMPNDSYVYGIGIIAVLAIGICVFFTYNTFHKNKKASQRKTGLTTKTVSYALDPI